MANERIIKLNKVLSELNFELPQYLCQLLSYNGYDNKISLSKIDAKSIENMENFAKQKLSVLLEGAEKQQFFDIFYAKPELFEVVEGDKQLLLDLKHKIINAEATSRPNLLHKIRKGKEIPRKSSLSANNDKNSINGTDFCTDSELGPDLGSESCSEASSKSSLENYHNNDEFF